MNVYDSAHVRTANALLARFSSTRAHVPSIRAMHTPVTHESLSKLIEHDLYFPFEFLLFRPRITHNMATGVLLKAGTETAETLVGHADFQLTDDVVRKMHYGHFTLYSKTVVWKSDNVYLAENIVATGYVRGNDVSFNTLDSLYTPSGESDVKSIYAALVPVSARHSEDTITSGQGYFNPMDVSGRFAENVPHLRNLDLEVGNPGRLHYRAPAHTAGTSPCASACACTPNPSSAKKKSPPGPGITFLPRKGIMTPASSARLA